MSSRRALPSLLAALLVGPLAAGAATAAPWVGGGPDEARVRLSGEVLQTAREPGQPVQTAVRVDDRLVPVEGGGVQQVAPGDTVTVDVAVPDTVERSADRSDLARARATSPAPEDSVLATETVDSALAPGGDALQVERVVASSESTASASTSSRTRNLTVVRVTPKGVSGTMPTEAEVRSQVAAADSFWDDSSHGQVRLRLSRLAPRMTSSYTCGQYFPLWNDIADRVGYTESASSSLVLVLPRTTACAHGLATVGANPSSGGYVYTSGAIADSLAHEIGHNMSLEHAERLVCSTRSDSRHVKGSDWGTGCRQDAYGDGQDVMGIDEMSTPSPLLSTPQALRTGMLPASAATTVGRGARSVTLSPLTTGSGTRVAKVRNAATGTTYYVEYRRATGRDRYNSWGHQTGVRVLRVNPTTGETVLIDPSPTGLGTNRDRDPVLHPGRTLRSYDGAITVRTESTSSTRAVVRISNNAELRSFTRTRDPKVTGTRGVGRTLTADPGAWSPTPSRYSYQWKRNGIRIAGATSSTYTPTRADAGRYLSVQVTARRTGYKAATKTSARVGVPIYAATRPSVTGTPKVGRTLYAKVGSWTPKPGTYSYRWYRGSTALPAWAKTYKVRSTDAGKKLRVKVTARRDGYSTGVAYSSSTTTVAR